MKTLLVFLILNVQFATAAIIENHPGWTFATLSNDASVQSISGMAKYAFFRTEGASTLNVYVNVIEQTPDIDVHSRDSWRAKIIGLNPKTLTILSDSTFRIGATMHYICHYQSTAGGTIPLDTILRATIANGKVYLFTWKQNHDMYQAYSSRVLELLRHVVIN